MSRVTGPDSTTSVTPAGGQGGLQGIFAEADALAEAAKISEHEAFTIIQQQNDEKQRQAERQAELVSAEIAQVEHLYANQPTAGGSVTNTLFSSLRAAQHDSDIFVTLMNMVGL